MTLVETVARALARSHGLSDHRADEHLKPWLRDAETAIRAIETHTPNAGWQEALTPSADTKAAYIGEFKFPVELHHPRLGSEQRSVDVPWTTIKEIMAAIRARIEASPPPGAAISALDMVEVREALKEADRMLRANGFRCSKIDAVLNPIGDEK